MQTSKPYTPPEPPQPFPHPILSPYKKAKPWLTASLTPIPLHRDSPYSTLNAAKGQCAIMGTPALNKTRTQQQREHGLVQHSGLHSKHWAAMHLAWFGILKSLEVGGNVCLYFRKHHQYNPEERESLVVQTTEGAKPMSWKQQ